MSLCTKIFKVSIEEDILHLLTNVGLSGLEPRFHLNELDQKHGIS